MNKVIKVMMFVWRNNNGKKEFFVLHRKDGSNVVLTGHVGDIHFNESLEDAAKREIVEELGVEPISAIDLKHSSTVHLQYGNKLSTEHVFLIEIPNKDVHFLEQDQPHQWHSLDELSEVLTFPNQKGVISKIKKS